MTFSSGTPGRDKNRIKGWEAGTAAFASVKPAGHSGKGMVFLLLHSGKARNNEGSKAMFLPDAHLSNVKTPP